MALIYRGKRVYFYRSLRINGRVVGTYGGAGAAAHRAARDLEKAKRTARQAKEAARKEREGLARHEPAAIEVERLANQVLGRVMMAMNYYRHRWEWRKRGGTMRVENMQEEIQQEQTRRAFLVAEPGSKDELALIVKHGGDLARRTEGELVLAIADGDRAQAEAIRRHLAGMRKDLAGDGPEALRAIDKLFVDRIVLGYLHLSFLNLIDWQELPIAHADFLDRLKSRADRRYQAALRSLALLRKAAPATVQVNVKTVVKQPRRRRRSRSGAAPASATPTPIRERLTRGAALRN